MSFRVLVLEDSYDTAETVEAYLNLRGVETIWATTVAEARNEYDPGIFDVLLVDYELPDGTGLDFLADADRDEAQAILWSGLDRDRELAASGLKKVTLENKARMPDVLDSIVAAKEAAERV